MTHSRLRKTFAGYLLLRGCNKDKAPPVSTVSLEERIFFNRKGKLKIIFCYYQNCFYDFLCFFKTALPKVWVWK